jgi:hypothetical protein
MCVRARACVCDVRAANVRVQLDMSIGKHDKNVLSVAVADSPVKVPGKCSCARHNACAADT